MKIENAEQVMTMQLMGTMLQKCMGDSSNFGVILESFIKAFEGNEGGLNDFIGGITSLNNYSNGGENILNRSSENSYSGEASESYKIKSDIPKEKVPGAIDKAIKAASKKYGVEESFIRAIIKQESGFNPSVKSSAGAMGLMQLMPGTARSLGVNNPYDIEDNVEGGTKYLKGLLEAFGNQKEMALAAYNAGPNGVKRRNVKSPSEIYKMPKETRGYVSKVMKYYGSGI
ncbi:lytic transglycosylase domain-containing protein [Haloimpatiens sp. FM7315]|uniref:lytic transglycosylase domain-containing protein n=1 Tax=Haloimpatiens sp. FM7315 TaxID=3298609 RepID=UPI00370AA96E